MPSSRGRSIGPSSGAEASAASDAVIATVYVPGSRLRGPARSPGAKSSSVSASLTYTSTVRSGMPWSTESSVLPSSTALAGAARPTAMSVPAAMLANIALRMIFPPTQGVAVCDLLAHYFPAGGGFGCTCTQNSRDLFAMAYLPGAMLGASNARCWLSSARARG